MTTTTDHTAPLAAPPPWDGGEGALPAGYEAPVVGVETEVAVPGLLALDVSWSMLPALVQARQALQALIRRMRQEPLVAQHARIAIVTYADTAAEVMGFKPIADPSVDVPELTARGNGTSYTAGLDQCLRTLEYGVPDLARAVDGTKQVVHRPTLFWVSDGQPNTGGDWQVSLDRIRALKFRPNVLAFGFGDADRNVIRAIADEGCAFFADDGQRPADVFDQILRMVLRTMLTVTSGAAGGAASSAVPDPQADPATKGLLAMGPVNVT